MNESQLFADVEARHPRRSGPPTSTRPVRAIPSCGPTWRPCSRPRPASPDFLEQPAGPWGTVDEATAAPPGENRLVTEQPGMVLAGRYKLLEALGEGGMGTVWLAQQPEPVKRLVAVKVIKPGMAQQVLARFEAERQALALMDHPNIARVHDAGAAATAGRSSPWSWSKACPSPAIAMRSA